MCLACFQFACTGVSDCRNGRFDPGSEGDGAPGTVRDYTALLAYPENAPARWNAQLPQPGAQVFVTYSFLDGAELPDIATDPYGVSEYWSFTQTQRDSTRLALMELSRIAGVVFVETTGTESMIQIFGSTDSPYAGWANYPWVTGSGAQSGSLVIDMTGGFEPGTSAFQVILHELGHAVGLKHPFEGEVLLASDLDTTSQTLMSYDWDGNTYAQYSPLDVQALQHLYGVARSNPGWTWGMVGDVFTLSAGGEDDTLIGVRTANMLRGGRGADHLIGGALGDTLYGGSGSDSLHGGEGQNRLAGGTGKDTLCGGNDVDRLLGGDGNDRAEGGWGDDRIYGDAGNDRLYGDLEDGSGWGKDRLYGGDGDDTIYGGNDADRIAGDAGNDRIYGGTHADTISGGDGNDWIDGGDGINVISGNDGDDTIIGGDMGHMRLSGGAGNDVIYGQSETAVFSGWDTISGGSGDDRIFGMIGSDSIDAGSGNDTAYGGAGWDTLDGGSGHDRLYGEAENDDLIGGTGNDTLYGGDGRDELWGNAGNDRLFGDAGTDTLAGGAGRDRLSGGADTDYFVFTLEDAGWTDLILDFEVDVDRIDMRGQGFTRASLSIADHANGTDSLLTAGPGGVLSVQIVGVRADAFDLWDVWV